MSLTKEAMIVNTPPPVVPIIPEGEEPPETPGWIKDLPSGKPQDEKGTSKWDSPMAPKIGKNLWNPDITPPSYPD